MFSRFDKDKTGSLDCEEFKMLVRKELKISTTDLSPKHVDVLVKVGTTPVRHLTPTTYHRPPHTSHLTPDACHLTPDA